MSKTDVITQARLKELLHYDPETGLLVWLVYRNHLARVGTVAGTLDHGYIRINVDGERYYAHRLIFLYMLGWMPVEVDHDNHIRHDNRWINLNPSSKPENSKNHTLRCTNTSGHVGIDWYEPIEKWRARAKVDGKNMHLGYFTEKSDAIIARQAADIKYNFHQNHGK